LLALVLAPALAGAADPSALLAKIRAVGAEGKGNAEAAAAWKEVVKQGTPALLPTLAAMDGADVVAVNWLRNAASAIAENALAAGQPLPVKDLEAFILDRKHSGTGRRVAYEWLCRVDEAAPKRLLPRFVDDPGQELRRDAVAALLNQAAAQAKKDPLAGKFAYLEALNAARDQDQVEEAAKQLKALGSPVDLAPHFGLIRRWKLLAPFDNAAGVGYKAAYPPEEGVDLAKSYKGKESAEARWVDHTTQDPLAVVDLNKALGKQKGTVAYAYTVVDSPKEQAVEVRAGCIVALKIFVNGKPVFGREEYHHGMTMDQHVGRATLRRGRNAILVKVCQNEQTEDWAQDWKFQLRLCDELGKAVPFEVSLKADAKEKRP
jgi:hypothetical protein